MKLTKRLVSFAAAFIICILSFTYVPMTADAAKNSAKGYKKSQSYMSCVIDEKGLFTEDELLELDDYVQKKSEKLGMYICIYLSNTKRSDYQTDVFADEVYDEIYGKDTDGVLYYMDLSESYDAYDRISTAGKAAVMYNKKYNEMLYDNIFHYLPATGETITSDKIYTGITKICDVFDKFYDEPGFFDYYYDSYTKKYIYVRDGKTYVTKSKPVICYGPSALIGVISGAIVALIAYFITKSNYRFKSSCNPQVYVSREETKFNAREDTFIRTYTTRTKIESSGSRGGGHGGGGHGGGGGSHGGGGGHR